MYHEKREVLLCRTKKQGHGFLQECLSPNFQVSETGVLICSACHTAIEVRTLSALNKERRSTNRRIPSTVIYTGHGQCSGCDAMPGDLHEQSCLGFN